jgi:hypothetical protein
VFTIYSRDNESLFTGTWAEIMLWVPLHGLSNVSMILAI